jgi:hypothetical protein
MKSPCTLVAVDPGIHAGVALFRDGVLVYSHKESEPHVLVSDAIDVLIIERPVFQHARMSNPDNVVALAINVGRWLQTHDWAKRVELVKPGVWKGNVSKEITKQRVRQLLTEKERWAWDDSSHDVTDAVALGLWYLGRYR